LTFLHTVKKGLTNSKPVISIHFDNVGVNNITVKRLNFHFLQLLFDKTISFKSLETLIHSKQHIFVFVVKKILKIG